MIGSLLTETETESFNEALCFVKLFAGQVEKIFRHARRELPGECCGLLGGRDDLVSSIYELKNVADNPLIEYEAAPEDLFAAQRLMRERGEKLTGIYHSHPQQAEPSPSQTDIRRAFYEDAVYFIVGFQNDAPVLRGFKIYESLGKWERAEFVVVE